ncbi:hypothetical protein JOB18_019265 [Solea senegalensis]|uniref:Nuclear nucleic acid-binding protein C1D n=1 Tax=Solea senegalensis TaxID=28829 RepID=A0AAV6S3I5_SOLSE|nr:hypothetical protein JOB18_019265 [Solea senegalensis]
MQLKPVFYLTVKDENTEQLSTRRKLQYYFTSFPPCEACRLLRREMAEDNRVEDYPHEIHEQLTSFDSSVSSVKAMLDQLISMPRNDPLLKLDPLDQAKLDLMSAYALNSLFWTRNWNYWNERTPLSSGCGPTCDSKHGKKLE